MTMKNRRKKKPGMVYVATNDCYKKVFSPFNGRLVHPVKIGRSKDCLTRLGNMSAGVFDDYKIHLILNAKKDVEVCEDDIHQLFLDYRINTSSGGKTEFFKYPLAEALVRIVRFVKKHNDFVEIIEDNGVEGKAYGRCASTMKRNKKKQQGERSVQGKIAKAKPSTFKVKFPDGTIIKSPLASEVFVNALVQFKLKRVAGLGFKGLVGRSEADFGSQTKELKQVGQWLINTHSSTGAKIQKIKSIAKKFGEKVQVTKI